VSESLSRRQAVALGLVVLLAVGLAAGGLAAVAAKQRLWADTVELTVGVPDAADLGPGTPVRVRGVDAGQVVGVDYPAHDGPGSAVVLRLRVDSKFAPRLYADAVAQVQPTGLLGGKVVSISPGTPAAGPLPSPHLTAAPTADPAQAAAKLGAVADEAERLLKEVRTGDGTLARLVRDDKLYADLRGLAADAGQTVKRADAQVDDVKRFTQDGREALRQVRRTVDSANESWVGRRFMRDDEIALLVRPTHRRDGYTYNTRDLFEPGTAILTDAGKHHLSAVAGWLKEPHPDAADVVISVVCDPNDPAVTPSAADVLTRQQAEAVAKYLKGHGVHKTGWWGRRKISTVGLGAGPSPIPPPAPAPPGYVQILLYTPAG
jgi:outer membrane protein OmpA-like peptidoglycan-associated protein